MSTQISYNDFQKASIVELLAKVGLTVADCNEDTYLYMFEGDDGEMYLEYTEKKDRMSDIWEIVDGWYVSSHDEWFLSQVVTPAEIESELGLSGGTVRQYLSRHGDTMIAKGLARKADGRTWLILRSAAYRVWADTVKQV